MLRKGREGRSIVESTKAYAKLCASIGIGLNVVLFLVKFICGIVSGSVSIQADAINNLTDVAVAAISYIGVMVAGLGAGDSHPFGHGRFEWITGLFSSMVVLVFGGKLAVDSIEAIRHPSTLVVNGWIILTLLCAILVKWVMYCYNHKIGEKIQSMTMKATAADSLGDMVSTIVILVSILIQKATGAHLDGWGGLAVSLFILYSGNKAMTEGIVRILGKNSNEAMKQEIERMVLEYEEITGISEFYIHDYGMGHSAISMHIEGNDGGKKQKLEMDAQEISYKVYKEYGCEATVQVDIVDDSEEMKERIRALVQAVLQNMQITAYVRHLKVIPVERHTLVTIEIACEHREHYHQEEIQFKVAEALKIIDPNYEVMIKVIREVMDQRMIKEKCIFLGMIKSAKLKA